MEVTVGSIVEDINSDVAKLNKLLSGVNRGFDPNTGRDTLKFSDMNVQIVNGSGTTNGTGTGTGNLIIGYNKKSTATSNVRGGSHMLVIGDDNNYTNC